MALNCHACGSEAAPEHRHCARCGASLPASVTPTQEMPTGAAGAPPTQTAPDPQATRTSIDPEGTWTAGPAASVVRGGFAPGTIVAERYRIIRPVGGGGMGEVWLAEQLQPVRRQVAFKVIKRGMDTEQIVARFEAERQALALMDHPAVAKVLDAGSTPRGRPFFVMEYVPGAPLTNFCDEHRLTTAQRLGLLQRVCDGVQHAHQKAIIHRDLKPSNVLVSMQDGKPAPKIIDFGIAKAIGGKLTDESLHTQIGVLIGTPEYMSPEQASLTGQDVDTRSDVYSLGVMLYELLIGRRPFELKTALAGGIEGLRKKICEEDPPTPSHRFDTLGDARRDSARRRKTDPTALRRELSGDLDWIVMKALEKDPARRYGSPAELAEDIRRYQKSLPVIARPPSLGYRSAKFIRRHRWGVAVGASLTVALIAGTIGTAIGMVRAQRETRKARAVTDHLIHVLGSANPERAQGREVTVREAIATSSKSVAASFSNQPELEMEVRATMALVQHELGQFDDAEIHLRRAIELAEQEMGSRARYTVVLRAKLARALMDAGHYEDAEREIHAVLPDFRRLHGDDHEDTLAMLHNLAAVYLRQERYDEAEPLLLEVAEGRRRTLGADDSDTQSSAGNLAHLYMSTGRLELAEPLFSEAVIVRRQTLGRMHPRTLISTFNLGDLYHRMGRNEEAEPLIREALQGFREVVGEDHPYTLEALGGLTATLVGLRRLEDAEGLALENYRLRAERFGGDHDLTLDAASQLARIYESTGRPQEAARYRGSGISDSAEDDGN